MMERDGISYEFEPLRQRVVQAKTTLDAMQIIKENKAIPTFLGYHGFPGCICASINDAVVHGIPSENIILKECERL